MTITDTGADVVDRTATPAHAALRAARIAVSQAAAGVSISAAEVVDLSYVS